MARVWSVSIAKLSVAIVALCNSEPHFARVVTRELYLPHRIKFGTNSVYSVSGTLPHQGNAVLKQNQLDPVFMELTVCKDI